MSPVRERGWGEGSPGSLSVDAVICITRCQGGIEGDFPAYGASSERTAGDETGKHFQTETLPKHPDRPSTSSRSAI